MTNNKTIKLWHSKWKVESQHCQPHSCIDRGASNILINVNRALFNTRKSTNTMYTRINPWNRTSFQQTFSNSFTTGLSHLSLSSTRLLPNGTNLALFNISFLFILVQATKMNRKLVLKLKRPLYVPFDHLVPTWPRKIGI